MKENFNNIYKGKTVLITGDTGLKGSWLAVWLLVLGAKVVGYALPAKSRRENFSVCGLGRRIMHVDADIRDYRRLLAVFSRHKPEIAFHLAAQPLVLGSYRDPLYTFHTNILGSVNFLEAVRHTPSVKVAINVTSDKCYKNCSSKHGYKETDGLEGRDPYSASKAASEIITHSYQESFFKAGKTAGIASVRAGNVIGGGDWADNRIFPDCMRALFAKRPIVVRNPGAVRPWQHVLEPLSGYLTLASLLYRKGKKYSGAWNFGPRNGNMVSVKRLVAEVIRQWGGGNFLVDKKRSAPPEAHLLYLDIRKAAEQMDWKPALDLPASVRFAVDEYRIGGFSEEEVFSQRVEHIEQYVKFRSKTGMK